MGQGDLEMPEAGMLETDLARYEVDLKQLKNLYHIASIMPPDREMPISICGATLGTYGNAALFFKRTIENYEDVISTMKAQLDGLHEQCPKAI